MRENLHTKQVKELVSNNYTYASVLYYFDIRFFEYSDETLEEVCKQKGLNVDEVAKELESSVNKNKRPEIREFPLDVLVEFLKHSHYVFIKRKMPYLSILVNSLDDNISGYESIVRDLKFIFPLFVEDFVHHIYAEEDDLFKYIEMLEKAKRGIYQYGSLVYKMENSAISEFAAEHVADDDTMIGIRKITNNYQEKQDTPLHLRVIYSELKDFEQELDFHARIENQILFPKSLQLENTVKNILKEKIILN